MTPRCILVVRLGAMGDIIHTLPAVCSLRNTWPEARILWAVEPKWAPLLENNPCIDHLEFADRRSPRRILTLRHNLRSEAIDLAIDFQGLLKSAVVIMFARAKQSVGLSSSAARESLASLFYKKWITPGSQHIVSRNLELSNAAGALAPGIGFPIPPFPIPQGRPEGLLPEGPFVLANPLAGWTSKQWPLEHYAVIAARLKSRGF
ncbi:MAG: hypothetical protein H7039_19280, partial [Bryobacteraceae bacterium]|nr:hypothetical protein [Bryobacteraceae bacterium]